MKTKASRIAYMALAAILLASCAAPPATNRTPRTVALIMSGDVVAYGSARFGAQVSVVDIDGTPPVEPYGPIELKPGRHSVTLKCDGGTNKITINVAAGEVYQFATRGATGAKGCVGALDRVRTTNP